LGVEKKILSTLRDQDSDFGHSVKFPAQRVDSSLSKEEERHKKARPTIKVKVILFDEQQANTMKYTFQMIFHFLFYFLQFNTHHQKEP
jgi:hypothetical protein